jgi:hypothetical protein
VLWVGRQSLLPDGQLKDNAGNCNGVARDGRSDRGVPKSWTTVVVVVEGASVEGVGGAWVRASEVRISAWDEAGSLTRAEMRRRLFTVKNSTSDAPIWTTRDLALFRTLKTARHCL